MIQGANLAFSPDQSVSKLLFSCYTVFQLIRRNPPPRPVHKSPAF